MDIYIDDIPELQEDAAAKIDGGFINHVFYTDQRNEACKSTLVKIPVTEDKAG